MILSPFLSISPVLKLSFCGARILQELWAHKSSSMNDWLFNFLHAFAHSPLCLYSSERGNRFHSDALNLVIPVDVTLDSRMEHPCS